jgi:hypothetical protein
MRALLPAVLILFASTAAAQVTGHVTDAEGQPIATASVD